MDGGLPFLRHQFASLQSRHRRSPAAAVSRHSHQFAATTVIASRHSRHRGRRRRRQSQQRYRQRTAPPLQRRHHIASPQRLCCGMVMGKWVWVVDEWDVCVDVW